MRRKPPRKASKPLATSIVADVPAGQHMARREAAVAALRGPTLEELLFRVGKEHRYIHTVTTRRDRLVRQARDAGASWTEIGAQLGVSRQAARKHFSEGNRSEAEGGSRRRATQPATVSSAEDEQ